MTAKLHALRRSVLDFDTLREESHVDTAIRETDRVPGFVEELEALCV